MLSSKNKCLNKLKVIKNVSPKLKISDALRLKVKVNYKGLTESTFFTWSDGFNCFMNKASLIFRLKAER